VSDVLAGELATERVPAGARQVRVGRLDLLDTTTGRAWSRQAYTGAVRKFHRPPIAAAERGVRPSEIGSVFACCRNASIRRASQLI
jgi:hypothetical protein